MNDISEEINRFIVFRGNYFDCVDYLNRPESIGLHAIVDLIKRKKCDKCFVIKMRGGQEPFFKLLARISINDSPFVVLKVKI